MSTPANESGPQDPPVESADAEAAATEPAGVAGSSEDTAGATDKVKPVREVDPVVAARMRKLRGWLIAGFAVVAVLLVAILIWTQFLPVWWAQTIGRQTGATVSGGIGWGLIHGFVFTLIPLVLLGFAVLRHWKAPIVRIVLAVLAIIVAVPNLLTLSIVIGIGGAYDRARTTMDVTAPWFRNSVLIGAIIAGVIAAGLAVWSIVLRRRHRELIELRAERLARDGKTS